MRTAMPIGRALVLGASLLALSACTRPAAVSDAADVDEPPANVLPPAENAIDRRPYLATTPVIQPQQRPIAKAVSEVRWTPTPGQANCPEAPVTGRLNGRPFICRYASVTPDDEAALPTWNLRFSSKPRGDYCGTGLDDDAVMIEWHLPVGVGEWQKALTDPRPDGADAWFVVEQPDGWPYTASPDWAAWVKIESLAGSTESGGAPSLTGRLVIMFADKQKSWVAGTFRADGCRR